jgi:hypothetical protein
MFIDLWFKIHMTVPEWLYYCTDYAEHQKESRVGTGILKVMAYWISQVLREFPWRKYGWRLAIFKYTPYVVNSGQRRMTLISASIFKCLIL